MEGSLLKKCRGFGKSHWKSKQEMTPEKQQIKGKMLGLVANHKSLSHKKWLILDTIYVLTFYIREHYECNNKIFSSFQKMQNSITFCNLNLETP